MSEERLPLRPESVRYSYRRVPCDFLQLWRIEFGKTRVCDLIGTETDARHLCERLNLYQYP